MQKRTGQGPAPLPAKRGEGWTASYPLGALLELPNLKVLKGKNLSAFHSFSMFLISYPFLRILKVGIGRTVTCKTQVVGVG